MNKDVYNKLVELSKKKDIITYRELCEQCNLRLDMSKSSDVNKIASILDEISSFENSQNRPLLSAVVIGKVTKYPGKGFFTMAKREGRYTGNNDIDKLEFFSMEVKKVFKHWDKQ